MNTFIAKLSRMAVPIAGLALLTGCPYLPENPWDNTGDSEYDVGLDDGFLEDDWYWTGFDDGYDTIDGGPIYYQGADIPYYEDDSYDAGYWDGVWYAYNDGYFVDYDYAFTIGFSEGYDLAYAYDWPEFIASDEHVEWLDGGFSDGYNDGFSEGRIFGAYDYETELAYDWLDAMLDYRDGTDLIVEDANQVEVGTGEYGPVYLYEYGTDPNDLVKAVNRLRAKAGRPVPSIRTMGTSKSEAPALTYRALPSDVQSELNVKPLSSPRGTRGLRLETSWLERISAYRAALESNKGAFSRR